VTEAPGAVLRFPSVILMDADLVAEAVTETEDVVLADELVVLSRSATS